MDILFALAVGQILMPMASWAQDPVKNHLPTANWFHLGVAFTITIASWIGYHESANRAGFQPKFFNVEFVKLLLDIAMVAVYFMLAAYAARAPAEVRHETMLVLLAFVLYLLWDLTSAYQKSEKSYREVWTDALADAARTDVTRPWTPTDWGRVQATATCALLSGAVCLYSWWLVSSHVTPTVSIVIDFVLVALLIFYRLLKQLWSAKSSQTAWAVVYTRSNNGWTAQVPALPELATMYGDSRRVAKEKVADAIATYLSGLRSAGKPIPNADAIDTGMILLAENR